MGSFQSFAQMLEKKIRREIEQEIRGTSARVSEKSESPSEPWTRLVGEIGAFQFHSSQKANIYHRNRPPQKPRPPHAFNTSQERAWSFFQCHLDTPLAPNFSKAELKQAFRKLALRLHPDQGGSTKQIQELLLARQALETLFT